jgi:hypothetical protein
MGPARCTQRSSKKTALNQGSFHWRPYYFRNR